MKEFTEQEVFELRALLEAYRNGKGINDLPPLEAIPDDCSNLLLETFNIEDQKSAQIPLSILKGLVDISGWTGVFPSANANVGECFGQITEEWQCGVTYLIYYGSNRYPSTGIGAANRADMAHAFVYPKDTVSVGAYAGVVMPAGLSLGSNPHTYVLDRLAGSEFRYLGNVIYKIYRVK